jgi:methionyl aminopeptidase
MPNLCEGCGKADASMQCPTCKKLGLPTSFFCTQDCFKASWNAHKPKHSEPPKPIISTMTDVDLVTYNFTGTLRPGKITPRRQVPAHIVKPDYATRSDGSSPQEEADRSTKVVRHTEASLAKIRRVCKLSREVLDIACQAARPGVTTDEIDRVVHEATIERGMYPSPLNYYNFPKSVCTSVNEIICHGIPDSRELEPGDIVNLDVSSFLDGMHADLNETVFVGKPDVDSVRLVHCAFECLMAGISVVAPDALYKHVGDAIEERAKKSNCSVVRTYTGHGVGPLFHTAPTIAHYANNKSAGIMQPGHVFTIEPMINLGTWQDQTWPDKWTSSTTDGKRSAQFEHTMVVCGGDQRVELLTNWTDGIPFYQKQLAAFGISPQ